MREILTIIRQIPHFYEFVLAVHRHIFSQEINVMREHFDGRLAVPTVAFESVDGVGVGIDVAAGVGEEDVGFNGGEDNDVEEFRKAEKEEGTTPFWGLGRRWVYDARVLFGDG